MIVNLSQVGLDKAAARCIIHYGSEAKSWLCRTCLLNRPGRKAGVGSIPIASALFRKEKMTQEQTDQNLLPPVDDLANLSYGLLLLTSDLAELTGHFRGLGVSESSDHEPNQRLNKCLVQAKEKLVEACMILLEPDQV